MKCTQGCRRENVKKIKNLSNQIIFIYIYMLIYIKSEKCFYNTFHYYFISTKSMGKEILAGEGGEGVDVSFSH